MAPMKSLKRLQLAGCLLVAVNFALIQLHSSTSLSHQPMQETLTVAPVITNLPAVVGGKRFVETTTMTTASSTIATIAYVVSISACEKTEYFDPVQGAAVLQHSIHLNSLENPSSGSKYGYKLYAIVHPDAAECSSRNLEALGFEVLVRDIPVPLTEIKGDYLRNKLPSTGCCGEKEFVKLHAYNLTNHPAVVHIDLDALILQPLDELFDAMLLNGPDAQQARNALPVQPGTTVPPTIDAYFARDYMGVYWGGSRPVGVHGGFFVLRPSLDAYNEFAAIIREGNFTAENGWHGTGHGRFHGGETIQGILPYYYDERHPGTAVELNRCRYNVVADYPRDRSGKCIVGDEPCVDCRKANISDVKLAHFTYCQKPWLCHDLDGEVRFTLDDPNDQSAERLCMEMQKEWFLMRKSLDESLAITDNSRISLAMGKFKAEQFQGYCRHRGKQGYIPFQFQVLSKPSLLANE